MKNLIFVDNPLSYKTDDSFVAYILPVYSKQDLLQELYSKLEYPDDFGFNWDALEEIYGSFWWIDEKNVVIVHECLSTLPRDCLVVYLDIIEHSIDFCKKHDYRQAMFVFSNSDKELICGVLNDFKGED